MEMLGEGFFSHVYVEASGLSGHHANMGRRKCSLQSHASALKSQLKDDFANVAERWTGEFVCSSKHVTRTFRIIISRAH